MDLNQLAFERCRPLLDDAATHRVVVHQRDNGTRVIDCGVAATGGLQAGLVLAEVCLAQLGHVGFARSASDTWPGVAVTVHTDHPATACMLSQYAGWQVASDHYYAMGSGPMRLARKGEELYKTLDLSGLTAASNAVGVLESDRLPPDDVCLALAEQCKVPPSELTLLVARTASLAGTVQIVARSVETALHKMHELKFDIQQVVSGFGIAPLPPVASDDLTGIGRTNDAILYGGEVTLWVRGDDETVKRIGGQIPSSSSSDHGRPFIEVFEHYNRDFYKIDRLLFSPAVVNLINLDSGNSFRFGQTRPDVLKRSFRAR